MQGGGGLRPGGLGGTFDAFGAQGDPGQVLDQGRGLGERHRGAGGGDHRPQPARKGCSANIEFDIAGHHPCPARRAVVVRPLHPDRTEHGVDGLGTVGDEVGHMPGPARGAGAAVARIGSQQSLQQGSAQGGHCRTDRLFQHGQAAAGTGAQAAGCQCSQGLNFTGEVVPDPAQEPPFSPSVAAGSTNGPAPGGDSAAAAVTGRASQIASFTSTIASVTVANLA